MSISSTPSARDIGGMFSRLAPRYRLFNRLSSLGGDEFWRRALVREIDLPPGAAVLDVGTGTGDLALALAAAGSRVTALDVSPGMLALARPRLDTARIGSVEAGADQIPFPDASFRGVVSAYVMRNLRQAGLLPASLREAARVLVPGGRLVFLDLTRPSSRWLRWGHAVYMRTALPWIGRLLFGRNWPGSYLKSSIESLPGPAELKALFESCGFVGFEIKPLWSGVVSLFCGKKPS